MFSSAGADTRPYIRDAVAIGNLILIYVSHVYQGVRNEGQPHRSQMRMKPTNKTAPLWDGYDAAGTVP